MVKSTQQQDNLSKEEQLALKQARLVVNLLESEGWNQVVRPFLMDKINQSFPDLAHFKDEREFLYASMAASAFKKVGTEFINWLESNRDVVKHLRKKEKGEIVDNFQIGK